MAHSTSLSVGTGYFAFEGVAASRTLVPLASRHISYLCAGILALLLSGVVQDLGVA